MMEMRVMSEENDVFPINNYKLVTTKNSNANNNNNSNKVTNNKLTTNEIPALKHNHHDNFSHSSPHRERAIDCPKNFVGVKKEPPRYPRPISLVQATPTPSSHPPTPTPPIQSPTLLPSTPQRLSLLSPSTHKASAQPQPPPSAVIEPPTQTCTHLNTDDTVVVLSENQKNNEVEGKEKDDGDDGDVRSQTKQQARVHKYREDLQARKQREEKERREGEVLRGSLRDSKKLLMLQGVWKNKSSPGCLDANFEDEEVGGDRERLVAGGGRMGSWRRKKKKLTKGHHLEIEEIVTSVRHVQKYMEDQEERKKLEEVSELVTDGKFHQLLKVYNKVVDMRLSDIQVPSPEDGVVGVGQEVMAELKTCEKAEAVELMDLLRSPLIKNLLSAHDKVIEAEYNMQHNKVLSSELEDLEYRDKKKEMYGEEVEVKVVRMMKGTEPLGATVLNDGTALRIGRLVVGGVAWGSGLLEEGDELLDINGHDVRGLHVNSVAELMANLTGKITFLVHPRQKDSSKHRPQKHEEVRYYRALYSYDPLFDHYHPCKDLGLSFARGEILKVIDTTDYKWWQAYRVGEEDQLAGLIPSPIIEQTHEELNELMMRSEGWQDGGSCLKKKRKFEDLPVKKEYLTYEEMILHPPSQQRRPVVLVGPEGLGGESVIRRIVAKQPNLFEIPLKYTTKPLKNGEIGNDSAYSHVSKSEFETKLNAGELIEEVSKGKQKYGISYESVWSVVARGRTCLLVLQPQSLKAFKNSLKNYPSFFQNPSFRDSSSPNSTITTHPSTKEPSNNHSGGHVFHHLMPYFLFISPPNIKDLKQLFTDQKLKISEEALQKTIEEGREVDQDYGHLFDAVVVPKSMEDLYKEVVQVVKMVVEKEVWVPKKWIEQTE